MTVKEMNNLSECKFVDENMWFITYTDFCERRYIIKNFFDMLNSNGRQIYFWYIYANVHMKETYKNAIWDYLNGYDLQGLELMRLLKFYKPM